MIPPTAIIAAGGSGTRSGSSTLKQFRMLAGKSVLEWSVEVLSDSGCTPILVAAPGSHRQDVQSQLGKSVHVVNGGSTRQASVANCLTEVTSEIVLIHDGARPLITAQLVRSALDALGDRDGVVVAIPMDETIKSVKDGVVLQTVDRDGLWRVQTPQVFRTEALREAHRLAEAAGETDAVDDAALIERAGGSVGIVEGTRRNLKITLPEDFVLAEALMATGAS
ncbi:MAG: 2-C-methyl-D-erythritol 4-phosphate cytidylyltransferase [Actinobacteria bacterium]|nr:2-C-methyl-D-erythritol 4-phosphate cytidylyltransferase [Actinomycetota bacterium]